MVYFSLFLKCFILLRLVLPGCPVKYLPISLHLPDLFKELQHRQLQSSDIKPWWHCNKIRSPVLVLGPSGAQPHQTALLEQQIQAAILSPLPDPLPDFHHSLKTSSTHPIKYVPLSPFFLVFSSDIASPQSSHSNSFPSSLHISFSLDHPPCSAYPPCSPSITSYPLLSERIPELSSSTSTLPPALQKLYKPLSPVIYLSFILIRIPTLSNPPLHKLYPLPP
jgi:hypothetical protein